MTDREDEILDLYTVHAYLPYDAENNPLTPFGNFAKGYELAWQARGELDAVRIKELETDRDEWKDSTITANQRFKLAEDKVTDLKDKLDKAKEYLLRILVSECDFERIDAIANEALQELDK